MWPAAQNPTAAASGRARGPPPQVRAPLFAEDIPVPEDLLLMAGETVRQRKFSKIFSSCRAHGAQTPRSRTMPSGSVQAGAFPGRSLVAGRGLTWAGGERQRTAGFRGSAGRHRRHSRLDRSPQPGSVGHERPAMFSISALRSSRAVSNSSSRDIGASSSAVSLRWAGRSVPAGQARRSRGSPAVNLPLTSEIA